MIIEIAQLQSDCEISTQNTSSTLLLKGNREANIKCSPCFYALLDCNTIVPRLFANTTSLLSPL